MRPKYISSLDSEESMAIQKWAEGEYSGRANLRAQDAAKMAAHGATIIAHNTVVAASTATSPYTGQAPDPSDWLTYGNFLARFRTRWILSNNGMEAITKIAKMKQTGSVADYNSVFVTVAYDTGLDDTALIPYYRMGLKPTILMRILSLESFKGNTITEWVDKAMAVNDIWHIAMGNKTGGGSNFSKTKKRRDNDMSTTQSKQPKERGRAFPKKKGNALEAKANASNAKGSTSQGTCAKRRRMPEKHTMMGIDQQGLWKTPVAINWLRNYRRNWQTFKNKSRPTKLMPTGLRLLRKAKKTCQKRSQ
jgi:hypothetical protein